MLFTLLGLVLFITLSIQYAHSIVITLDEGSYLYKGASYLRGEELPYQLTGSITNKTPLSFFIPGISQILFGDGIRSGRYFSVFLGSLMLLGLWLTVRRVSNPWYAASAVWLVALNQNSLVYYARAMSQVISILFLIWCLYFVLGEGRKKWELTLGGVMAALLVLTRQNMLPFLPILALMIAWQFGWKKTLLTQLPGWLLLLFVHILYWPGIYIFVWRAAMPAFVTSFLSDHGGLGAFEVVKAVGKAAPKTFTLLQNIQEMFGGIRSSAVPYAMFLATAILFPWWRKPKSDTDKQVVMMLLGFLVLTFVHIYAALENNVFLYSFPAYLTFFAPMMLPVFALALPGMRTNGKIWQVALALGTVLTFFGGIGLHLHKTLSEPILALQLPAFLVGSDGVLLWQVMVNKFSLEKPGQAYLFATLAGLAFGTAFTLLAAWWWKTRASKTILPFANRLLLSLVALAAVLTPTPVLSHGEVTDPCDVDAILTFEQASQQLEQVIPAGSTVFWDTDNSPSPAMLLYLDDVRLFPSQLNGRFYLKDSKNFPNSLPPFAWTKEIGRDWILRSDFIVLSERTVADWDAFLSTSSAPAFEQVNPTGLTFACDHTSYALIYKKVK